jgi:pyrimidine deaminase RibD-like protein
MQTRRNLTADGRSDHAELLAESRFGGAETAEIFIIVFLCEPCGFCGKKGV